MLAKIFATSLVVLILLPFTAPFSTCELLAPRTSRRGQGAPLPQATAEIAVDNAAALVPARMTTSRARLIALVGPHLADAGPAAPARTSSNADSSPPPQRLGAQITILRL